MITNLFIGSIETRREMPLPKDVMNFRWDMAKVVKNEGHTADLKSLLLDAQKAADGQSLMQVWVHIPKMIIFQT
jgi:hypothetical protein